jgi:isopentenyldiphosphate isomerase
MSGEEMFDIYDEKMLLLGQAPRSEVHRCGYWHRSFHCWLVRLEEPRGKLYVRFQKRQSSKDTFPNCYDITVAGHLKAGETVRDAAREIEEEIGLLPNFDDLVWIEDCREEAEGIAGGVPFIDREVSSVYAWASSASLAEFRLQREEVAGIYEADADELIDLFEGRRLSAHAAGYELSSACDGDMIPVRCEVTAEQFVERPSTYYGGLFRALKERFGQHEPDGQQTVR